MGAALWRVRLAQLLLRPSCSVGPPRGHSRPSRPLPGPEDSCEAYRHVLGQDKVSYEVPRFHGDEERFFVEGLSFPDARFTGLLSFHITLLDDSNEVRAGRGREGERGLHPREGRAPGVWRTPDLLTSPTPAAAPLERRRC